jgi:vancomycin resistance protein YoaR
VTVRYEKRVEKTTSGKLGAACDAKTAVDAALEASAKEPNLFDRLRTAFTGPDRKDVPLPLTVAEEGVAKGLLRFSVRIGQEPKNARVTKVAGRFKTFPPKPGKELDAAALTRDLQAALDAPDFRSRLAGSLDAEPSRSKWLAALEPIALAAATRPAEARVTLEHVETITSTIATFNTGMGASSRNRTHNVSLACKAIDGTVLLPRDVFSYNEVVGPRVPSAGYKEAPVIVRGQLQPGTGGGICQVSSTLYNAVLLADLEIVRRRHHAIPVAYVPAGRDATVVDGAIDFQFKNRLERPIAVGATLVRGRLVVSIFGHPDDRKEVEIVRSGISSVGTSVRTVSDPRLVRGRRVVERRAQSGRRVTVTRIVKRDGQVLRKEVVSRDYYRPFPGVVRIGTRSLAPRSVTLGARSETTPKAGPAAAEPEPPAPADGG